MRDAINQTGRQMWYSITQQLDYDDGQDSMHCIKAWSDVTLCTPSCARLPANRKGDIFLS